jgi:hypothetical protein
MTDSITCYERDEQRCEDAICLRIGCCKLEIGCCKLEFQKMDNNKLMSACELLSVLIEAVQALHYLAENPRPSAGQVKFNSEHLYDIAESLIANGIDAVEEQVVKGIEEVEDPSGKEAVRLLDLWTEIEGAEKYAPYHATMALLEKPNSAGWVWAREVRQERNFDKEQERTRKLAMDAIAAAEKQVIQASEDIAKLRAALEPFAREAATHSDKMPDQMFIWDYEGPNGGRCNIRIGDLRKASAAFAARNDDNNTE